MMTPSQRLDILRACSHDLTVSDPRDSFVDIHYDGLVLTIDYCIKHGTGSGKILGVRLADNKSSLPPAVIDTLDKVIGLWAGHVRKYVREDLNAIDQALKPLWEDKNVDAVAKTDASDKTGRVAENDANSRST